MRTMISIHVMMIFEMTIEAGLRFKYSSTVGTVGNR